MSLSTEPADLYREIVEAEAVRKKYLEGLDEMIAEYHGPEWDDKGVNDRPVNYKFEAIATMLPLTVFDSPTISARGGDPISDAIAEGLAMALNRVNRKECLEERLRPLFVDYMLRMPVAFINPDELGADSNPDPIVDDDAMYDRLADAWWPIPDRIPVSRFLIDPYCNTPEEARWAGHVFVADHDDLIKLADMDREENGKDATWLKDEIERLTPDADRQLLAPERGNRQQIERNEVVGYELWIRDAMPDPDATPAQGYNGAFVTLVKTGNGMTAIRKLRSARVPKNLGPYAIGGAYPVPNSPWPLSPLMASQHAEDRLNAIMQAAHEQAMSYKRLILVPQGLEKEIKYAPSDTVIPVAAGAIPQPIVIEVGGITDQMLRIIAYMREQLERVLGMDTAQSGQVSGRGTATENLIADQSTKTRQAEIRDQFGRFCRMIVLKQAHALYHNPHTVVNLGSDGSGRGSRVFVGGVEDMDLPLDDLDIEFSVMSMARPTEGSELGKAVQALQLFQSAVPQMRMFPEVDWRGLWEEIGNAMGLPELVNRWDAGLAAQLMGMQAQPSAADGPSVNFGKASGPAVVNGGGSSTAGEQNQLAPSVSASGRGLGAGSSRETAPGGFTKPAMLGAE